MDKLELNLMGRKIVRTKRKARQEDVGGGWRVVALTQPLHLASTPGPIFLETKSRLLFFFKRDLVKPE